MSEISSDGFTTENLTKFPVEPGVLMGSTDANSSVNYTVIFVSVAVFSILYLIFWYYCLKCCCYSIRQCFESKLITRGEILDSAAQSSNISETYIQHRHSTSDISPLIMSHDGVAPYSQQLPPHPPRYEEILVASYQRRYPEWNPYSSLSQQLQQSSVVREPNDPVYIRNTPPPPYEEILRT